MDASALFAALRRHVDDAERRLLAQADALACAALDQVEAGGVTDAGTLAGLVEKHARLAAAEEAYVAVAPDLNSARQLLRVSQPVPLADRFAVRASVAYKGSWVRRIRTFAKDQSAATGRCLVRRNHRLACSGQAVGRPACSPDRRVAQRRAAVLAGGELDWQLSARAGRVLAMRPTGRVLADEGFLVLTVDLVLDGAPWIGAAPLIVGKPTA